MLNGKRALVAAVLLAWLPLFIGVAYPAVWQWSETASSNGSADPTINFREGMAPSAVNDSARAMMAALAGYRDDISGSLNTTGTASAYLVSTNQGLPNVPTDGQMLAITVHITNGIAPTLSADGGSAFAIQSSAGVAVASGTLISGSPYSLKFSVTNNAWILRDFYPSPLIVPLGTMMPFTGPTAPNSNFVLPYGQCISRTTYATYFSQVGTTYGACDGVTTFAVIDMRGAVPGGVNNMGGTGGPNLPGLNLGTLQGTVGGTHSILLSEMPSHTHSLSDPGHFHQYPSISVQIGNGGTIQYTGGVLCPVGAVGCGGAFNSTTNAAGIGSSTGSQGGGNAMSIVQPTMGINYILRII